MKKIIKSLFFIICLNIFAATNLLSDNTYFIDFSKVLNQSLAGSDAQKKLKNKFESQSKKFKEEEENIKKIEVDLISQKKVLSKEEYQTKLDDLRKKVSILQSSKQESLNSIAKARAEAKQELLKAINPILKDFMESNNIRLIINKDNVILGDTTLEITDKIIEILNQKLKSIKIN